MNIGAVFMDPAAATAAGATKIASGCKRVEFFWKNVKKIFHLVTQIIYVQPINQSQKLVLVGWVAGLTMGHKKDL